jgi:hypothetical protein
MIKKPSSSVGSKFYRGIRLYHDDIELILSILKENDFEVKITDKEFEYDSLDDLIDKQGVHPDNFSLYGEKTGDRLLTVSVSISFEKDRISIFSHNLDKQKAYIAYTKIGEICETHESKVYKILNPWIPLFPLMFLSGFINLHSFILILVVLLLALSIVSALYRYSRYQVILRRRHIGGFWKQNSDRIWLLILGAVFGFFLKIVWDLLSKFIQQ